MNFQRFLKEKEVLTIIGVSRSTLDRWVKAGVFPKPYRLSPIVQDEKTTTFRKAWWGGEIKEWIDSRPRIYSVNQEADCLTKQLNKVFSK